MVEGGEVFFRGLTSTRKTTSRGHDTRPFCPSKEPKESPQTYSLPLFVILDYSLEEGSRGKVLRHEDVGSEVHSTRGVGTLTWVVRPETHGDEGRD